MTVTSQATAQVARPKLSKRPVIYWGIVTQLVILMGCITVDSLALCPTRTLYPLAAPIVAIGLWNLKILDRARRALPR